MKCWLSKFGTSCCWEVPLTFVGPDSAELLIADALGQAHLPYYRDTLKRSVTYSWNNSAKILNNHTSTLRKGSKQKMRVSPYRVTLLCLWPTHLFKSRPDLYLLQGTRKTSETTLLSRPNSAQNQIYPQETWAKVDCYLVDLAVQRAHQQELTYLIFTLPSFTSSKFQSYQSREVRTKNRDYRLYTQFSSHLPRVKVNSSSG